MKHTISYMASTDDKVTIKRARPSTTLSAHGAPLATHGAPPGNGQPPSVALWQ